MDAPSSSTPVAAEHAVMHLLYAREFTKMMRDIGLVQQNEPWKKVFQPGPDPGHGRRADVEVAGQHPGPDELVAKYGADSIRLFLMFMGPWDQGGPWSPTGIGGVHRFLNRVWTIALDPGGSSPGDAESGDAARPARTKQRRGRRFCGRPTRRSRS
jgi:leucyl-tRNA synthetase